MHAGDFDLLESRCLGCEGVDGRCGKLKELIVAVGSRGRFCGYPGGSIQGNYLGSRDHGSTRVRDRSPDTSVDVGTSHVGAEQKPKNSRHGEKHSLFSSHRSSQERSLTAGICTDMTNTSLRSSGLPRTSPL